LGGDVEGAIQVNLMPGLGRPQDVYTAVADRVREQVEKDLAFDDSNDTPFDTTSVSMTPKSLAENPQARKYCAQLLGPDRIERKTVKQTVMTSVYGVTFVGARDQVRSRLREKYYPETYNADQIQFLSAYITPKIFHALDDMFQGARQIQEWLARAANEIARSVPTDELTKLRRIREKIKEERKSARKKTRAGEEVNTEAIDRLMKEATSKLNTRSAVIWTTPLGLVVTQPYRSLKSRVVSPTSSFIHIDFL
jgi:DNA-directed RNA polymerase